MIKHKDESQLCHYHSLKGRLERAAYRDQDILDYVGNPLIEALPPIWSDQEVMRLLQDKPEYHETQRTLPGQQRHHLIDTALNGLFVPLPMHHLVEQAFSRMIRGGYLQRNPADYRYMPQSLEKLDELGPSLHGQGQALSMATSTYMIGTPGVGKTSTSQRILLQYPQVIKHRNYGGRPLTLQQIVWLKLECPFDGRIKNLCLNFFQAVDNLLSTNYYLRYHRCTTEVLLVHMARIALLHCLGILVIDEVQHLMVAKTEGSARMLNFFVQMENTIGTPIVLVGTNEALPCLTGAFRQTRRGTGQGDLIWEPLKDGKVWDLFVQALWRYQFTKTPTKLTAELSHALFDYSAGIADFAIKVYRLAQHWAINAHKDEMLTPEVLRRAVEENLRLPSTILGHLLNKNWSLLQDVPDVVPLQKRRAAHSVAGETASQPASQSPSTERNESQGSEPLIVQSETSSAGTPSTEIKAVSKSRKSNRKQPPGGSQHAPAGSLLQVVQAVGQHGTAPYETLRQAGFVRQATAL